jgi:hypothetical protein
MKPAIRSGFLNNSTFLEDAEGRIFEMSVGNMGKGIPLSPKITLSVRSEKQAI